MMGPYEKKLREGIREGCEPFYSDLKVAQEADKRFFMEEKVLKPLRELGIAAEFDGDDLIVFVPFREKQFGKKFIFGNYLQKCTPIDVLSTIAAVHAKEFDFYKPSESKVIMLREMGIIEYGDPIYERAGVILHFDGDNVNIYSREQLKSWFYDFAFDGLSFRGRCEEKLEMEGSY